MDNTPMNYAEAKAWSQLSPKPVIFNGDMCFWMGLFMHKTMALMIASNKYLNIPVTPSMKSEIYWNTVVMHDQDCPKYGIEPPFNISEYTDASLVGYVGKHILLEIKHKKLNPEWKNNYECLEYFL